MQFVAAMLSVSFRVNGRAIISESVDPSNLGGLCAISWLRSHPFSGSIDTEFPNTDAMFSVFAEPGKGKEVGLRTDFDLPAGAHVGWVEGTLTRIHPNDFGSSYSFQLSDEPVVFIDSGLRGSLVTLINEDVFAPNCAAEALVHCGRLRIRVSTLRPLVAGTALSLSYRRSNADALAREAVMHHWGNTVTPSGTINSGTRLCANHRYHAGGSKTPLTSLVCVECSERFARATPFCSLACFASHVADHASVDTSDVLLCTPLRSNGAKPVITRLLTARALSLLT